MTVSQILIEWGLFFVNWDNIWQTCIPSTYSCDTSVLNSLCCRFSQDDNITQVLKTMLFFTILMITMPIGLYFFSKSVIFEGELILWCPSFLWFSVWWVDFQFTWLLDWWKIETWWYLVLQLHRCRCFWSVWLVLLKLLQYNEELSSIDWQASCARQCPMRLFGEIRYYWIK